MNIYNTLKLHERQISLQYIKYYWNACSLEHLHAIHDCIHTTMGSYVTVMEANPRNIDNLALYKSLLIPILTECTSERKNYIILVYPSHLMK